MRLWNYGSNALDRNLIGMNSEILGVAKVVDKIIASISTDQIIIQDLSQKCNQNVNYDSNNNLFYNINF